MLRQEIEVKSLAWLFSLTPTATFSRARHGFVPRTFFCSVRICRFIHRSPHRVLEQTEATYRSCKRRIEREGSVVLSSINFTCSVRHDRLEVGEPFDNRNSSWANGGDRPCMFFASPS